MSLLEAIENSKLKRDLYKMNVYVLSENNNDYFSVLEINLFNFIKSNHHLDKKIYYTAWNLKT